MQPKTSCWLLTGFSSLRLWKLSAASLVVVRDELRRRGFYPHANAKPPKPAQIAAVYTALDALREMLEPRGVPLLVVSFPRDWQLGASDRAAASEHQRVVREYCEKNGVAYIDLLDYWYGQPIEAYFRPGDDSHPHAEAVQSIARVISDAVVLLVRQR